MYPHEVTTELYKVYAVLPAIALFRSFRRERSYLRTDSIEAQSPSGVVDAHHVKAEQMKQGRVVARKRCRTVVLAVAELMKIRDRFLDGE